MHRASLNSKRQLVWTGFERFIVAWGLLSVLVHPLLIKIPYYFLLVYKLFFFLIEKLLILFLVEATLCSEQFPC